MEKCKKTKFAIAKLLGYKFTFNDIVKSLSNTYIVFDINLEAKEYVLNEFPVRSIRPAKYEFHKYFCEEVMEKING
jgi:hypothetical protein